jgi:predicted CXXCH cytochrome family protein
VLTTAVLLAAVPCRLPASAAEQASIEFISPWPGSLVKEGPVVLAGRLPPEAGQVHFLFNGRPLDGIKRAGAGFSATLKPKKGFNEVEIRFGDRSSRLTFVYGMMAAGQMPYAFHEPLLEGTCRPCHREGRGGSELTEAAQCYQCHKAAAVLYSYVHGPIAAGICLICHDAHGSSLSSLTRMNSKEMCTSCHDQPSTTEHAESRTRVCTLCHDPHYSMLRYLLKSDY